MLLQSRILWPRLIHQRRSSKTIVQNIFQTFVVNQLDIEILRDAVTIWRTHIGVLLSLPTPDSYQQHSQMASLLPEYLSLVKNFQVHVWWVKWRKNTIFTTVSTVGLIVRCQHMSTETMGSMTTLSPSCLWPGDSSRIMTLLSLRRLTKLKKKISTVAMVI